MAERGGFEPTLEFPLNTLSKRAPSTTRPSLRSGEKRQPAVHKLRFGSSYQDITAAPQLRMEYGEIHDPFPAGDAGGGGVRGGGMRQEEGYAHPRILLCRQSREPVGGGGQSGDLPRAATDLARQRARRGGGPSIETQGLRAGAR